MARQVLVGVAAAAVLLLGLAHAQATTTVYLTTRDSGDVTLAGVTFKNGDIVAYNMDAGTASMFFDGSSYFRNSSWVTGAAENLDALYIYADGRILLSTAGEARLGQNHLRFQAGDIVLFDMATDTAGLFMSGDGATSIFRKSTSAWARGQDENVDAFDLLPNGHYLLSTASAGRLGVNHVAFQKGDIVEYDPETDTASIYFASTTFRKSNGNHVDADDVDVDGVSVCDGDLLLSVAADSARLGAPPNMLTFADGDIVRYDAAADLATIFLSQDLLHCSERDLDGLSVLCVVPTDLVVPEPMTACGLCLGVLGLVRYVRRRAAA